MIYVLPLCLADYEVEMFGNIFKRKAADWTWRRLTESVDCVDDDLDGNRGKVVLTGCRVDLLLHGGCTGHSWNWNRDTPLDSRCERRAMKGPLVAQKSQRQQWDDKTKTIAASISVTVGAAASDSSDIGRNARRPVGKIEEANEGQVCETRNPSTRSVDTTCDSQVGGYGAKFEMRSTRCQTYRFT